MRYVKAKNEKNRKWILTLILFFVCLSVYAQPNGTFRFVAMGDNGCGCTGQRRVAERMFSWWQKYPYFLVLLLGDNIYPGHGSRGGSASLFEERFDAMYKPLLIQGVKFYATLGNHDLEKDDGIAEIADKERFHILQHTGYYSFHSNETVDERPLVEFFSLNSNRLLSLKDDPAQIAWFSKALNDSKAIWKIAFFHHPIYAPEGPHPAAVGMRMGIEKLLNAAGVQLVLSGHDHFYARMKTINGFVQMISGGGGRDLKTPNANEQTEKTVKAFHFVYFEVFPDRMEFWAIPVDGLPFDQGKILASVTLGVGQAK